MVYSLLGVPLASCRRAQFCPASCNPMNGLFFFENVLLSLWTFPFSKKWLMVHHGLNHSFTTMVLFLVLGGWFLPRSEHIQIKMSVQCTHCAAVYIVSSVHYVSSLLRKNRTQTEVLRNSFIPYGARIARSVVQTTELGTERQWPATRFCLLLTWQLRHVAKGTTCLPKVTLVTQFAIAQAYVSSTR